MDYDKLVEKIWDDWKLGQLSPQPSDYISEKFSLDYLPEPYLQYGEGDSPMYFLSTNPGHSMIFKEETG